MTQPESITYIQVQIEEFESPIHHPEIKHRYQTYPNMMVLKHASLASNVAVLGIYLFLKFQT